MPFECSRIATMLVYVLNFILARVHKETI